MAIIALGENELKNDIYQPAKCGPTPRKSRENSLGDQ